MRLPSRDFIYRKIFSEITFLRTVSQGGPVRLHLQAERNGYDFVVSEIYG